MNKSYNKKKLWFDRLLSKSLLRQFLILGVVLIVALGLSYLLLYASHTDWKEFCEKEKINQWLLPIYLLVDSNALNNLYMGNDGTSAHGWMLFASSITFLIGAFVFNGIVIGIITNSIERRVSNYKEGHIHYLKSGHYIIMGYDDMVPSIITSIFEDDKNAFVLLMSAAESEYIREKLRKVFDEKKLERIIINYGHRTSKDYYNDIHLEAAERIYIVGMRSLPSHDAINVECVDSICTYLEQPEVTSRPERIVCVFEDLDTYAAFKTSEIFERVKDLGISFVPYNFYTGWAKQVFVMQFHKDIDQQKEKTAYPTVYGKGRSEYDKTALTEKDPRYVHLVFVGTTNFAVAFAMEAAHVLHFPNGDKVKTRITFIDKHADKEKDEFITRNRHYFEVQKYRYCDLSNGKSYDPAEDYEYDDYVYFDSKHGYKTGDANFLDVEFEFIKGDVFAKTVQDAIGMWAEEHNSKQYLSVFLAMANQRANFVLGMNMPDAVYDNEVPVFIRQDRSDNFVSNLRASDEAIRENNKKNTYLTVQGGKLREKKMGGRYCNIYPFGMNETAYSEDEISLNRAKLINYLYYTMPSSNKFQSLWALDAMTDKEVWKKATEYWNELPVALKWSNLYAAYSIRPKLAILRSLRGVDLSNQDFELKSLSDDEAVVIAKVEHNRWNVEKLLMGYRKAHKDEDKYAHSQYEKDLVRNKQRFIHHDIRPYDQLDGIQELDKEFSRYIPWILKMTKKEDESK